MQQEAPTYEGAGQSAPTPGSDVGHDGPAASEGASTVGGQPIEHTDVAGNPIDDGGNGEITAEESVDAVRRAADALISAIAVTRVKNIDLIITLTDSNTSSSYGLLEGIDKVTVTGKLKTAP